MKLKEAAKKVEDCTEETLTYAGGTVQDFTDPHPYLQTIKEELSFRH